MHGLSELEFLTQTPGCPDVEGKGRILSDPVMTAESVRELGSELGNWGRWGDDDQIGTMNLITEARIAAAAATVTDGLVVSCAVAFDASGPMPGVGRFNPVHTMTQTGEGQEFPGGFQYADDELNLTLQCATQWDALSHVYYDGMLYNGYPSSTITKDDGAAKNSIARLQQRVVARGVLLDVTASLGLPWLDDGVAVAPEQLDQCAEAHGVEVGPGDVVLVGPGASRGCGRRESGARPSSSVHRPVCPFVARVGSASTTSPRSRPTPSRSR